ncbi:MAG: efflux RND transporter periplasmic adaptor subunit [Gemmatimonadales bacterium]
MSIRLWSRDLGRGVRRGAGLAATLALAISLGGCAAADGDEAHASQAESDSVAGARVINVEVTPVSLLPFVDFIRLTGEVEALHDVTISAEESGPIARFMVEKGTRVRAGQAIAKIDDAVLRAQVDEAQALADLAREQYERQRRLWEDEQIGSEIAYLTAKSGSAAADARLATLRARLAKTVIRSPVGGIFDEKFVDIGEMAAPGTPVARVVAINQVKIVGGVPERFAQSVEAGDSAWIRLDVLPDRSFVGAISFVGTSVDERSRTVPIEVLLDNPHGVAKPRMVANVQIERERFDSAVVVPQDVVVRTEDGYQVFVVAEREGRQVAEARPVSLGPSYGNRVVIAEGLVVGDPLITLGHRLVEAGSFVRVVNPGEGDR